MTIDSQLGKARTSIFQLVIGLALAMAVASGCSPKPTEPETGSPGVSTPGTGKSGEKTETGTMEPGPGVQGADERAGTKTGG
jgi:hypothetical protein